MSKQNSGHYQSDKRSITKLARIGGGAAKLLPEAQADWFLGPYGWQIDDFTPLVTPVTCAGALGLWNLPAEVEQAVRTQVLGSVSETSAVRLLR